MKFQVIFTYDSEYLGYVAEVPELPMLDLSKEGVIANFFLQGIKEGRNMARNLVISPYITNDSPELSYHFDRSFSSADEEINIFLTHLILSIRG